MEKILMIAMLAVLTGCDTGSYEQLRDFAAENSMKYAPMEGQCRLICVQDSGTGGLCKSYVVTDECFAKLRGE